eukprot:366228-Chlamydomonas_euryale.AAC.8
MYNGILCEAYLYATIMYACLPAPSSSMQPGGLATTLLANVAPTHACCVHGLCQACNQANDWTHGMRVICPEVQMKSWPCCACHQRCP